MKWIDVQYKLQPAISPAIDEFKTCVKQTHVNGGIVLACFVASNPEVFDLAARHDLHDQDHIFITFLNAHSVKVALPELKIGSPTAKDLEFHFTVPLAAEGELSHVLLAGGAYRHFEGTVNEARAIGRKFVAAMIGDRFLQVSVAASSKP